MSIHVEHTRALARLLLAVAMLASDVPAHASWQAPQASAPAAREPDVIYVPTSPEVVDAMLKAVKVHSGDVVYDLGSGDGRIVVTAVKDFGAARGIGIDIDPIRTEEGTARAQASGVSDRVRFLTQDIFESDFRDATVVTLYLLPSLNLRLRPKLLAELKPGTRIVSHSFDMGDWKPEQTLEVAGQRVYVWTIPAR